MGIKKDGEWIETFSGKRIDVLDMSVEDIVWKDMLLALSRECRFGNHTLTFYSVAQHTVNCIKLAQMVNEDPLVVKYVAGHDLCEAYLVDVPRPIKKHLPEYYKIEKKVQDVIWTFLGLPIPDKDMEDKILKYDNEMLYWEGKFIKRNVDNWAEKYKMIENGPELNESWFKEYLPSEIEKELEILLEDVFEIDIREKKSRDCGKCKHLELSDNSMTQVVCKKNVPEFNEDEEFINCSKFESYGFEYPILVNKLKSNVGKSIQDSWYAETGSLVSVRLTNNKKTYLGILLGEADVGIFHSYDKKNRELNVYRDYNPVIYVPDLRKLVYGMESWWKVIKSEEDFKKISDEDINNVWYVKLWKDYLKGGDSIEEGEKI